MAKQLRVIRKRRGTRRKNYLRSCQDNSECESSLTIIKSVTERLPFNTLINKKKKKKKKKMYFL